MFSFLHVNNIFCPSPLQENFIRYKIFAMDLIFLDEVDSTNKYAKEHVDEIPHGAIVYTDNQTAGRGRLNRKWTYIGKDNIYASLVLKPSDVMQEVYSNLTQLLCLLLCQTFEEYGVVPKIKWPNDIQINGKKISGILAEAVFAENKLKGIVLGFGINLNTSEEILAKIDQPATSLNVETGKTIDKQEFLTNLLNKFCLLYNRFIEDGFLLIRDDYKKRAGFLNREVTVKVLERKLCGVAVDITNNGALKLLDKNNREHVLLIGDIL